MKTHTTINTKRVMLGGAAAGALIFILNGVLNGAILSGDFENWMHTMGSLLHPPAQSTSMCLWTLMSFIYGMGGVWLYASIRPRYGAGPKTALTAGLSLWIVSKFVVALDLFTLGIFPERILVVQLIGALFVLLPGVCLGAWVYRE
jgi:hypothetical protein